MTAGREDEGPGLLLVEDGPETELFESRPTPIPDDSPTKLSEPKGTAGGGEVGIGHRIYQTTLLEQNRDELQRLASSYEGLVRMVEQQPDRASVRRREVSGVLGGALFVAVLLVGAFCAGVGVGGSR